MQALKTQLARCCSVLEPSQMSSTTRSGSLIKDFGRKITVFGKKFKRPIGKMSFSKMSSRKPFKRTYTGFSPQRRYTSN